MLIIFIDKDDVLVLIESLIKMGHSTSRYKSLVMSRYATEMHSFLIEVHQRNAFSLSIGVPRRVIISFRFKISNLRWWFFFLTKSFFFKFIHTKNKNIKKDMKQTFKLWEHFKCIYMEFVRNLSRYFATKESYLFYNFTRSMY